MNQAEVDRADAATWRKRLWGYLALTVLLSWSFWVASGILPTRGVGPYDFRWLFAQMGVFGPSLAGLFVSAMSGKELRRNAVRILPALLLPLVIPGVLIAQSEPARNADMGPVPAIATVVVCAAVILFFSPLNRRLSSPGTGNRYERPGAGWIVLSLVFFPGLFLLAWVLVNIPGRGWAVGALRENPGGFGWLVLVSFAQNLLLGGSLGEETGWRGFLLPQLLKRNSPVVASLILGVIWAVWHAPADVYGGFVFEGAPAVLARIIWTLPVATLFTWFYLESKGSLLVALFLHTSINVLPDLDFSNSLTTNLLLFVLLAAVAVVVATSSRVFTSSSSPVEREGAAGGAKEQLPRNHQS
jgi:membrane protease YdiL (CAAX protease family)